MQKILLILVLILLLPSLYAQVDDEFAPQTDFNTFQQQADQCFHSFSDSINKRFAKELERQWEEFQIFAGEKRPEKPKPRVLPVADTARFAPSSDQLPVSKNANTRQAPLSPTPPQPTNLMPSEPRTALAQMAMARYNASFFRNRFRIDCPSAYSTLQLHHIDEKSVATFWNQLAQDGKEHFCEQCRSQIAILQLNDWGVYVFAGTIAKQLFPNSVNEQTITTVFIVNQLGYKAKVARKGTQLVCLFPSSNQLYSTFYIKEDGVKYYIMSPSSETVPQGSIFTYPMDFPDANALFDMNVYAPLQLTSDNDNHIFSVRWRGEDITVDVSRGLIDFYNTYPQVDLEIYANAAPNARWASQMRKALSPMLADLDEYAAVASLLSFMHKNFPYAYDVEQFGKEKYFFCEESCYYEGSDCEDHSILFSYLVRDMLGLETVLLDYPDHIATAVHFNDPSVVGDFIVHKGKKYIVCDPTYFGASVGETMTKYKNVPATVIELRKK